MFESSALLVTTSGSKALFNVGHLDTLAISSDVRPY